MKNIKYYLVIGLSAVYLIEHVLPLLDPILGKVGLAVCFLNLFARIPFCHTKVWLNLWNL